MTQKYKLDQDEATRSKEFILVLQNLKNVILTISMPSLLTNLKQGREGIKKLKEIEG